MLLRPPSRGTCGHAPKIAKKLYSTCYTGCTVAAGPETKQLTLKIRVAKYNNLRRSAETTSYGTNDSAQSTTPVLILRTIVQEMQLCLACAIKKTIKFVVVIEYSLLSVRKAVRLKPDNQTGGYGHVRPTNSEFQSVSFTGTNRGFLPKTRKVSKPYGTYFASLKRSTAVLYTTLFTKNSPIQCTWFEWQNLFT